MRLLFRSSLVRLLALTFLLPALNRPARAEVFEKQAVVSQEANASAAGLEILRRGGNAADAAIATAFALAVTCPEAGNLGGGGFLVAFEAETGEVTTLDFRETAPRAATERMYLDAEGRLLPRHRAGARAAGVPGTVRGLGRAHERLGSLPWADLVRPAERLAREGFPVSGPLARSLNDQLGLDLERRGAPRAQGEHTPGPARLADFPASVAAFRKPDGEPWRAGDLLVQPDLADTLDRIARDGPDEFYRGATARLIVRHMRAEGGLIDEEDLGSYRARVRPPVHTTFRGLDVYGMGPPSSGGVVIGLMLNILERFDLDDDGPRSPRTLHRVAEAMRRAYHVRAARLADPDFVDVPVEELTSKPYAERLASTIDERATPSIALAEMPVNGAEGEHTTHLSTIDRRGNAVALTYTLEELYGSKSVVAGAGFLLNNEMGDFNLVPGLTDANGRIGTPANRIEPGKRMLSSMAPTIVLSSGRVRLVTGSPGGRTIPNTVLWVVLNVLEFGLDPRAAVEAPRTHHQWFPDVLLLEGDSWDPATVAALREMGHRVGTIPIQGNANTIAVDPSNGRRIGVADPRRGTSHASGD